MSIKTTIWEVGKSSIFFIQGMQKEIQEEIGETVEGRQDLRISIEILPKGTVEKTKKKEFEQP